MSLKLAGLSLCNLKIMRYYFLTYSTVFTDLETQHFTSYSVVVKPRVLIESRQHFKEDI